MPGSQQAIKSRIASVTSTQKITNAMQLVASAKLTKARKMLEENREYSDTLQNLLSEVLQAAGANNRFLKEDKTKPSYVFVITSDMGLCGGYNANIFKELEKELSSAEYLVLIGSRGASWAKARNKNVQETLIDLNEDTAYTELSNAMERALNLYNEGKIGSIKVLYTKYKNTLTFVPTLESLLPPTKQETKTEKKSTTQTIFEPSKSEMLEQLIPMIAKSVLYAKFIESKTSEQASRRMAMENATNNAEDLLDNLNLEYNRIRQGAITQEITEIVSGANALQ